MTAPGGGLRRFRAASCEAFLGLPGPEIGLRCLDTAVSQYRKRLSELITHAYRLDWRQSSYGLSLSMSKCMVIGPRSTVVGRDQMRRIAAVVLAVCVFGIAAGALAADTPKSTWLKAKCALCHGEDGSGNTPEGKKRNVPDLRREAIQKLSDAELTKLIAEGHAKMPAFRVQLTPEQVAAIVQYIRSIAKK